MEEHLDSETECPDTGTLLDMYGNRGLDFIVDTGARIVTATSVSALLLGSGMYCVTVSVTQLWL